MSHIEEAAVCSNKKIRKQSTIKITRVENKVAVKDNVKYLGVSLDQSLGGKYITKSILNKGYSRFCFLSRQAKYLNRNYILCHFDYACSAWFEGLQVNLQKNYKFCKTKL